MGTLSGKGRWHGEWGGTIAAYNLGASYNALGVVDGTTDRTTADGLFDR